jgi:hypothetical protein
MSQEDDESPLRVTCVTSLVTEREKTNIDGEKVALRAIEEKG